MGSNGHPNTLIATTATVNASGSAGSSVAFSFRGVTGCTGSGCDLTAQTWYILLVRNPDADPTTNNATYRYMGSGTGIPVIYSNTTRNTFGATCTSTTGISGCGAIIAQGVPFFRLEYANGTYAGWPYTNLASDTTNTVYGTRENGTKLVLPGSGFSYNIIGVCMQMARVGTPGTPIIRMRVGAAGTLTTYDGSTLGTTHLDTSFKPYCSYFDGVKTIAAGTTIRVIYGVTSGGDSSNRLQSAPVSVHNNANSLALKPSGSTTEQTYCTGSCSSAASWTDPSGNSTTFVPYSILLQPVTPITSSGSSGVHASPIL